MGFDTRSNIQNLLNNSSGIQLHNDSSKSQIPFWASLIRDSDINAGFNEIQGDEDFSRLEKLMILSIKDALKNSDVEVTSPKTLILLSSAKGNIDLLEKTSGKPKENRVYLPGLGRVIQDFFKNPNTPLIISNGCISGVLSLITAFRLMQAGVYDNIIVTGGDIISEFTVSGFQSFKALSDGPCKPFDKNRNGLNLGEGVATIILTANKGSAGKHKIQITGGATSNDANHISGPSRTGDGLFISVNKTIKEGKENHIENIDFISAHGTATVYNDEMESLAFTTAKLEDKPINSLKGYFGHTLGAAGLIESVVSLQSLRDNVLFASKGFETIGVTGNLNVIEKTEKREMEVCLKTASGFGGCNAAILFKKNG